MTTRLSTRWILVAMAAALVWMAAGCGIPSDDDARTIPPEALPAQVTEPRDGSTTTSVQPSATTLTERIFLVRAGESEADDSLEGIDYAFDVSREEITEEVMRTLMDAPNEQALANLIPPDWEIINLQLNNGILDINFNTAFRDTLVASGLRRATAQIVFTAMSIEHAPQKITGVRFFVEGQPTPVATPTGEVAALQPVTMSNYPSLCARFPGCSPPTAGTG